jgi:hypothetical protein
VGALKCVLMAILSLRRNLPVVVRLLTRDASAYATIPTTRRAEVTAVSESFR